MNLKDAVNSGKGFRRPCWNLKTFVRVEETPRNFDILDALAEDYEIEDTRISLTEGAFDKAAAQAVTFPELKRLIFGSR